MKRRRQATAFAASVSFALLTWVWLALLTIGGLFGVFTKRHNLEAAGIGFGVAVIVLGLVSVLSGRHRLADRPTRTLTRAVTACSIVAALVYAWTLSLGLLSDDHILLALARLGDFTPDGWPYLRPLPIFMWRLIDPVASAWGLHLLNVLLHGCNVLLIGRLAGRLFGGPSGIAAALLFAVVPAHTEAVAWGAGVFDVTALCAILFALNAWCAAWPAAWRALGVMTAFGVGLFSKETAIVLPVLLLALDVAVRPEPRSWDRPLTLTAVWAAAMGMVVWRSVTGDIGGHLTHLPAGRYAVKELLLRPFRGLAAPLRAEDMVPVVAWVGGLCLIVLAGALLFDLVRRETDTSGSRARATLALEVGLFWPLVAVLPLLQTFYVAPNLEGSRYLYVPAAGMALAASASLSPRWRWRRDAIPAVAIALLVVMWGVLTHRERQYWRDAAALRDTVLTQAAAAARAADCATLDLHDAPDNVNGVYVFREGLSDAVAAALGRQSGRHACEGTWNGHTVVVTRAVPPSASAERPVTR